MEDALRVLIVDDSENDALLAVHAIKQGGMDVQFRRVETRDEMKQALLEDEWQIVLADYAMPRFSILEALMLMNAMHVDIPFIMLSGAVGEDKAVAVVKAGVHDYVMKDRMHRLVPAIKRELARAEVRRKKRQLEGALEKLSLAVKQTADSVMISDTQGIIEYVNSAFEKLTGFSATEVVGQPCSILKSGRHANGFYRDLWQTILGGNPFRATFINRKKDGSLFHEEKTITPVRSDEGNIIHFVSTGKDVSERVKAEVAQQRLSSILSATSDFVMVMKADGTLEFLNAAGRAMLGLDDTTEVSNKNIAELLHDESVAAVSDEACRALKQNGLWSGDTVLKARDGRELPVSQVLLAHRDASGEIEYVSSIARDIRERTRLEAELRHKLTHDEVTGLPGKILLYDRLRHALESARRHHHLVAVLFCDVDDFKRLRDTVGSVDGDELLKSIGERLGICARHSDTVARFGADEFVIVLEELSEVDDVYPVVDKIRLAFSEAVMVGSRPVSVSFTIGAAFYPNDGENPELLLRLADKAMLSGKIQGKQSFVLYHNGLMSGADLIDA